MIDLLNDKLDAFFTKGNERYRDYSIWEEVFIIVECLAKTDPDQHSYQLKRVRDLKNVYDYSYQQALLASLNK